MGLFSRLPSRLLIPGTFCLKHSPSHLLYFTFSPFIFRREASAETIFLFHFSRLGKVPAAEDLASQMLKGCPRDRVSARQALVHDYFSALPAQLHQLPDGERVRVRARVHVHM